MQFVINININIDNVNIIMSCGMINTVHTASFICWSKFQLCSLFSLQTLNSDIISYYVSIINDILFFNNF